MSLKREQIGKKQHLRGKSGRWLKNQINRWIRRNITTDRVFRRPTKG